MPDNLSTKDFLNKIMQLESSGGKNIQHSEVPTGVQAGTTAIGRYGLMPNTVREIINRQRLSGQITPQMQNIGSMTPVQMKSYIESNPDVEDQLANALATKVIQRQGGDENRAAYSWENGDNLLPSQITDKDLSNSVYVQRFKRLNDILQPSPTPQDNNDNEEQ